MRTTPRHLRIAAAWMALAGLAAACAPGIPAPSAMPDPSAANGGTAGDPALVSAPLRTLTYTARPEREEDEGDEVEPRMPVRGTPQVDPLAASALHGPVTEPSGPMPSPAVGFDGLGTGMPGGFTVQWWPPDPSIAVGLDQVVETVNTAVAIFDKSGSLLLGPVSLSLLYSSEVGTLCSSTDDGDAVVVWDHAASRWVITWFAIAGADGVTTPYEECIAVSATADATGSWYAYHYAYDTFNDYPKLAVWGDSYVVTFNMFTPALTWSNGEVCAYDRTRMLLGQAPRAQQCRSLGDYGGTLAADTDSATPPPAGAAIPLLALDSYATLGAFQYHVDWATPANTTLSDPQIVTVPGFDLPCTTGSKCIPQPPAAPLTVLLLDSLGDRLMNRLAYRNDGGVERMVVTQSVDNGTGNGSNVRWYELEVGDGRALSLVQAGTLAPGDGLSRWMPSAARDKDGNMALGYSRSGTASYPSLAWSGRLAADTAGTLSWSETTIAAGAGSQSGKSRWGDYSAMVLDPVDECTFWFAGEYHGAASGTPWSTRIASFKFPSCGADGPQAVLSAPVTPTSAAALDFGITLTEEVGAVPAGALSAEGTGAGTCVVGTPVGIGSLWAVSLTGCGEGTVRLRLAQDSLTGVSTVTGPAADVVSGTVLVDRTVPVVSTPPVVTLRVAAQLSSTAATARVPVTVTWAGSDPGAAPSGIAAWLVESSPDGVTWTTVAAALPGTQRSLSTTATAGTAVRFRVTPTDVAGNTGTATAGGPATARLVQQTAFTYGGTWTTAASSSASGGSTRYASVAGRSATYKVTARAIALVVSRAPLRGRIRIYVDGVAMSTVDTARSPSQVRSVLWTKAWSSAGTHTVKVVVLGTSGRPRVDLDALVVLR